MTKFMSAFLLALLLSLAQPWLTVQAASDGPFAETKAVAADDSGTAFFKDDKQCGWLCHAEMKYYPMLPSGNFGPACAIPKGATAVKPTATCASGSCGTSATTGLIYQSFGSGGSTCGPNGCGGSTAPARGFFRR